MEHRLNRRALLGRSAGAAAVAWLPGWARAVSAGLPTVSGAAITLTVARQTMRVDGRAGAAIGINGTVPGPLIRLREGQRARIRVVNRLDEATSIHWHGLLLPAAMDGVPGISFPGIAAGESFDYDFPVRQSGTYWYHSHSGMQEQEGHYGPLVIDPAEGAGAMREHVILLSDHSASSPHAIYRRLKLQPGYYNRQRQTIAGLVAGRDQSLGERLAWGRMRMDPADVADATAATYTYLVNGHGPEDNWTGLFTPGAPVKLRIINASAMTSFNVRIPGLPLTIVAADGLAVRPVETDEFQIGVAETYDAIVVPGAQAYSLIGESVDRSGFARATLAPRSGMVAPVPPLRPRPLATMQDMGMGMDHAAPAAPDAVCPPEHAAMGHCTPGGGAGHAMDAMDHEMRDFSAAPGVAKTPGVQTIAPMPVDRTGDRGQGLEGVTHRVLVYRDLVAVAANPDPRPPARTLEIHLTGNMERFMWAFDGVRMRHEPFAFTAGERVRVTLVNDTMMGHPIHLHGHFFELVTGHGDHAPRKHTVLVQPGGTASFDLTADAIGDWAFHCHLLYHMHAGMMRVVSVRPPQAGAA